MKPLVEEKEKEKKTLGWGRKIFGVKENPQPGDTEGTAGGRWGSGWRWFVPGSPRRECERPLPPRW